MDNRAVSPVVGKLLAAGIVVVYIASVTGLLVGGLVPDYRAASGSELGERVTATAAADIERAIPTTAGNASVHVTRTLPRTIAGERYRLELHNRTLRLDHPNDGLDTQTALAVAPSVTVTNDTWESGDPLAIEVTGASGNRTLTIGSDTT